MENQLPNDGLEDFLKKSFERYTESPPSSVWGNIEKGLVPAAAWYVSMAVWAKAAAAVLVLGSLFCWHQYTVKKHIGHLTAQVDSLTQTIEQLHQVVIAEQTKTSSLEENLGYKEARSLLQEHSSLVPFSERRNILDLKQQGVSPKQGSANNLQDETLHFNSPEQATQAALSETKQQEAEVSQLAAHPLIAPNLFQEVGPALLKPALVAKPLNKGLKWSVGAQFAVLTTQEKVKGRTMPDMPFFSKPIDQESQMGKTWMGGLNIQSALSHNLEIQSGLWYKQTDFESTHRPRLKFRDLGPGHNGGHGGGGGGGHINRDHEFNYDLNTSVGVVSMELDLRQSDTLQHVEDSEPLELEITTQQQLKSLCIPLMAQYQIGRGRLRFHIKGGLLANILLDYGLKIKESNSLNNKFSVYDGRQLSTQSKSLRPASIDYLAGVGLTYALSPRIDIGIEPIISGALISHVNSANLEVSGKSWGLSGGIAIRL